MRPSLARSVLAVAVALTQALDPSRAQAQSTLGHGEEPVAPTTRSEPPSRTWYGWQTLVADGASLTAFAGAMALYRPSSGATQDLSAGLLVLGASGYVLGAPALHLAHDAPWRAAGSLGLRLGLPGAGLLAGLALAPRCSGSLRCLDEGLEAGAVGTLLGVVGAIVVDAATLAFEPAAKAPGPLRAWTVAPRVDARRGEIAITVGAVGW